MASWSFVVTNNHYEPLGEVVNASERKVALPLSKLATASMTVRLDNPLADALISTACYIKGYRWVNGISTPQLRFFGPVVSAEESADRDKATVAVNAIGSGWLLTRRLAGKSSAGTAFSTVTDRARIAKTLIDTANTENETGISTAGSISAASGITYVAGPYKFISDCVTELATAADGFDWYIDPLENYTLSAVTSQKIGSFRAAPIIGSYKDDAVFEWGGGRNNIVAYKLQVARDTQANQVYHLGSNGPSAPGAPVKVASDAQSVLDWKLLEDIAQADIMDNTLRQQLVNQHVAVRKNPRRLYDFTPHIDPYDTGRLPIFGVDYDVGDSVNARTMYNGRTRFDAAVRCYGFAADINAEGIEQQTLTLVQE